MSKGPFNARIKEISATKEQVLLVVEPVELAEVLLWPENPNPKEFETIALPIKSTIWWLTPGDIITYYRAERNTSEEPKGAVVLAFKRDLNEQSSNKGEEFFWINSGNILAEIKQLPRVVEILCRISDYYGKRRDVLELSVDILKCTQDPEAVDALFSIRKELLNQLLDNDESSVAVQVADSMLTLLLSGADLEHPSRRDLRQILSLAVLHGTHQSVVDAFISSYEGE